jgi:putative DNA primase/helicase
MTDSTKSVSTSIVITPAATTLANGIYVFQLSGPAGPPASFITGVFVADNGAITGGEQDVANFTTDSNDDLIPFNQFSKITGGSYSTTPDGNLQISINVAQYGTEILNGVLASPAGGFVADLYGSVGNGTLAAQSVTAAPSGGYAVSLYGGDKYGQTARIGGVLNIDSPGRISGAGSILDVVDPGAYLSGTDSLAASTVSAPDAYGRVMVQLLSGSTSLLPSLYLAGWVGDSYGERRRLVPQLADLYSSIADDLDQLVGIVTAPFAGKDKKEYPAQLSIWEAPYEGAAGDLRKAAKEIANLRGIDSALTLAQPLLHVDDDRWDRDPYLLAVCNGVVDLRTSELLPAVPEQWITKMAGADFDPTAKAVAFLDFLEQVQPDREMRQYLQRLAGYSSIGRANEQLFFIFVGGGANGKGTYVGATMDALGEYAVKGPLSVLAQQDPGRIRNDLAMLAGARLVSISETPENFSLDEATIKAVTGQDIITARFLNKEFFSFRPCFTPILDTNHAPRLRDTGEGLWRRPMIVPWPVKVPKLQRDLDLREKLLEELPGILAWIIAGARAYLEEGLQASPKIAEATQTLRNSCDDLGRWLESCVEQGSQYSVQSAPLYENFRSWCQAEGIPALSQPKFTSRLSEKLGSEPKKRHGKMFWQGLRPLDWKTETNIREGHSVATAQGSQTVVIPRKTTDATVVSSPGYVPTVEELQRMPGGSLLA